MITDDTITAIATPVGSGGVGIIRISGDKAIQIASRVNNSLEVYLLMKVLIIAFIMGISTMIKAQRLITELL